MDKKLKYNRIQAINVDTGEVIANTLQKVGSEEEVILKVSNPKQKEALIDKNKNTELMSTFIGANEGRYFHLIYKYSYPLMVELQSKYQGTNANLHIMRFMVLGTYMTFGGKLFDDNGNEIKKSSLSKIWDVKNNRKSINETYNLLIECNYIYETKEGYIMINEELIKKGAMEDFEELKKHDKDLTYTRVFSENILNMYEGTNKTQRKLLANLFKVLPFINFKYNVFCANPTEVDEDKIIPLKWSDLARLCGYDEKKQLARFKKDFFNLSICGYDVIGQFTSKSGYSIVINPKVYYAGNNIEDVKSLYVMFKMSMK